MRGCWGFSIGVSSALLLSRMSSCLIGAPQWPVRDSLRERAFRFSLMSPSIGLPCGHSSETQWTCDGPCCSEKQWTCQRGKHWTLDQSAGWVKWPALRGCLGEGTQKSERLGTLMGEKRWTIISFFKIIYEGLQAHTTQTHGIVSKVRACGKLCPETVILPCPLSSQSHTLPSSVSWLPHAWFSKATHKVDRKIWVADFINTDELCLKGILKFLSRNNLPLNSAWESERKSYHV